MTGRLAGRTAIVTGASRGLGRATALALAAEARRWQWWPESNPDMVEAGVGSIINVTSVASRVPGDGPYQNFAAGVLPGYADPNSRAVLLPQ